MTGADAGSLRARLDAEAARSPDTPAIIDANGRAASRLQFARRVSALVSGFSAEGLRPGDGVLFAVRPSAGAIALLAALIDLGAVVIAAQLGVGDTVFSAQMDAVRPKWIVAESPLLVAMRSKLVRRFVRLRGGALPGLAGVGAARVVRAGRWLPLSGGTALDTIVARGARAIAQHERSLAPSIDPEAPAFIVFTSGTTAVPKAVVHGRRSIAATLRIVGDHLEIASGDVLLARDVHLILPAIFAGATAVMPRHGEFSAAQTLAVMRERRVTHMFEVTANCRALADEVAARAERLPETLRRLLIGAAPVHASLLQRIADVLPRDATAYCVYGLTEMVPVAAISLADKLAYDGSGDIVGAPVRGAAARVSESGELVVRGENLFTGYLGEVSVTEHATGDLAQIDGNRIVLLGRVKDMIIRREHNIYPELHETVIERIPGVRRCAMVGVYDDALHDERVVLAIETEEGFGGDQFVREIARALRTGPTRIDGAAMPDLIMLTPLPESGRSRKVDKEALRELARARLA